MKINILLVFVLVLTSCTFLQKTEEQIAIARVNKKFLYLDDVEGLISAGTSKTDSTLLVQNYINTWAKQQLLVAGAELNLSKQKQAYFDKLISQYKIDLYGKAYLEALVKKNIDTIVTAPEAEQYYQINKKAFKLNEELVKLRYIYLEDQIIDFDSIKTKFERFDLNDKKELDSMAIQFKAYALNDSVWVKYSQVLNKIPPLRIENKNELLKKTNFIQLKDSLGVYLMHINDVLLRNSVAPLQYVKSTIDQIVINKRKLELTRELEKEITKDAIKNKQFEIYN